MFKKTNPFSACVPSIAPPVAGIASPKTFNSPLFALVRRGHTPALSVFAARRFEGRPRICSAIPAQPSTRFIGQKRPFAPVRPGIPPPSSIFNLPASTPAASHCPAMPVVPGRARSCPVAEGGRGTKAHPARVPRFPTAPVWLPASAFWPLTSPSEFVIQTPTPKWASFRFRKIMKGRL